MAEAKMLLNQQSTSPVHCLLALLLIGGEMLHYYVISLFIQLILMGMEVTVLWRATPEMKAIPIHGQQNEKMETKESLSMHFASIIAY